MWRVGRLVVLAAVALYVLSGLYVVQPDERGVVTRFGRLIASDVPPGIHYRIPWPVDSVETPQVTAIKRMSVGYKIVDKVRGLSPTAREIQFVTGDTNIIEVQLLIQYVISDASKFLYMTEEPHWLVRRVGESVLTEELAVRGVDEALTVAKTEIGQAVKVRSQAVLDLYGTGVQIVAVHVQEVSPPREVADAFREVASAREDKNRIVHEANGYANRVVPMARGEGAGLISAAEGYRAEKILYAQGEAARFSSVLAEYRKGKAAARTRIYLEVMEDVLSKVKKYVLDEKAGEDRLDLRFLAPRE